MKYTAALVGMEFLMQPIRRAAVVEEVNDNQLPMEPLHYPAVAIGAEELTPMATGRSVRRMGHSQPGAMMNHKHLSNLLIRLIQKLQAGLEVGTDSLVCWRQRNGKKWGAQQPAGRRHRTRG